MKKIITYGTFDLLHIGHINLLKRAKSLGDYLIVGLSNDDFNVKKGKMSVYTYKERKIILEALKYVDEVIEEESWEQKQDDIRIHEVDIFVMGDDWKGEFDYLNELCEVKYISRTQGISTTHIKEHIKDEYLLITG